MMTRRPRRAFRHGTKTRVFWYSSLDGYDAAGFTASGTGSGAGRYGVLAVVPKDVAAATSLATTAQAPQNDVCKIHAVRGQLTFGNLVGAAAISTGIWRACIYQDEVVSGETQGGAAIPATSIGGFSQILTLANSTRDILWFGQGYLADNATTGAPLTTDQRTVDIHVKSKRILKQGHALFYAIEVAPMVGGATNFRSVLNVRTLISVRR